VRGVVEGCTLGSSSHHSCNRAGALEERPAFGDMAKHKAHDLCHIVHIHGHAFSHRQLVAKQCCIA